MHKALGIISIKGGVGKTTIASSLAADLAANYRKKVLLVDANYNAPNLGLHMDIVEPDKTIHHVLDNKTNIEKAIHNRFGVDVIPGSYVYPRKIDFLKLSDKINKIKDNYHFVIIDSSPSLNEELLSTMLASDALFIVTTPDYPTLSCSLRAANLAKQRGKPIAGIIINKVRDPKYELTLQQIENSIEIPVVARIPDDKTATRAIYTRIPTPIYNKNSPFSKEINRLNAALTGNAEKLSLVRRIFPISPKKEEVNRQLLKEDFYTSLFSNE
ncbi:MAG: AAA family ATPase [Nanoarchaeota archaeon]|nr:AAA family ATPase [Nanoarchaeota archaeon]